MYIDIHVHTNRYSVCSVLAPRDMVHHALKMGLDGLAITEHHRVWSEEEVRQLKEETSASGLVILRGQEITTYTAEGLFHGDILVFGFDGSYPEKPTTEEIIRLVHQVGGIAIAAHPFRWGYGHGEDVYKYPFDGIEVLNTHHHLLDVQKAERAVEVMGTAATGGSDAHDVNALGLYLTYFEAPVDTEEALIREIKARRCNAVRFAEVRE